ncbi:GNAT family N-acetyltransferase [Paenibacillus guangzhouensis]|uniref:GNAT family N-acetyltransferase n=1 Tax=Paenibacillus guangzhouensis TaxID=1473112 RepID=UPI001266EDCA|nr:GNAT family N-acetyltransferase [Paenibacillus guangzhouensis]
MHEPRLVKDYKQHEMLRKSFDELAVKTFGISFEAWYQHGFWNDRYIPYSFAIGDQVIANVSVNLLDIMIDGENRSAIQIGTVMTHEDYRGQGLSRRLMTNVLEDFENQYDVMYLFANDAVLDYYPKFGFEAVEEEQCWMDYSPSRKEPAAIRKLNVHDPDDLQFINHFVSIRMPVSKRFGTIHTQGIFMFYALNIFSDDMYYLADEDVICVYKQENGHMEIYDLVHIREVNTHSILAKIAGIDTEKVTFYYTPDDPSLELKRIRCENGLFVRTNGRVQYPVHVKHPVTSIA